MIGKRSEIARYQSDFYRDCYYKMLNLILFELVLILGLIAVIMYVVISEKKPPYYATSTTGQLIRLNAAT